MPNPGREPYPNTRKMESLQGFTDLPTHYQQSLRFVAKCFFRVNFPTKNLVAEEQKRLAEDLQTPDVSRIHAIAVNSRDVGLLPLLKDNDAVKMNLSQWGTDLHIQQKILDLVPMLPGLSLPQATIAIETSNLITLLGLAHAHVLFHMPDVAHRETIRKILLDFVPHHQEKYFRAGTSRLQSLNRSGHSSMPGLSIEDLATGIEQNLRHPSIDPDTPTKITQLYENVQRGGNTKLDPLSYVYLHNAASILSLTKKTNPGIEIDLMSKTHDGKYVFNETAWQGVKELYVDRLREYLAVEHAPEEMQRIDNLNTMIWQLEYLFSKFFALRVGSIPTIAPPPAKPPNPPAAEAKPRPVMAEQIDPEKLHQQRMLILSNWLGVSGDTEALAALVERMSRQRIRRKPDRPEYIEPIPAISLGSYMNSLGLAESALWSKPKPGDEFFSIEVNGITIPVPINEWRKTSKEFRRKYLFAHSTKGETANPKFVQMTLVINKLSDFIGQQDLQRVPK